MGDRSRSRAVRACARTNRPTTCTSSCRRPSGPRARQGLWLDVELLRRPVRPVPRAIRVRAIAKRPWTASTSPRSRAGTATRWASGASDAPLFPLARLRSRPGPRTWAPRSASSSGSEVLISDLARHPGAARGPGRLPADGTPARAQASCPAASTPSTTSSSRSRTRATSSARGAPTRSWTAAAAS